MNGFLLLATLTLGAHVATNTNDAPKVSVEQVGDTYVVTAQIELPQPVQRDVAWQVLTDYDHIAGFMSSVRESQVVKRDGPDTWVRQKLVGKLLIFSRTEHLLLRVSEDAPDELVFDEESHQDFQLYRGTWKVHAEPQGLVIDYLLRLKPRQAPPPVVGKPTLEKAVVEVLGQFRNEIVSRANRTPVTREAQK
ncbi:MAG: SRPBCC family protein [Deltaproteobacteria bacterium]|nr:SRPBCC family protein [Deltaproteobacteria bacterium]